MAEQRELKQQQKEYDSKMDQIMISNNKKELEAEKLKKQRLKAKVLE
jgi:hypothetical protein